MRTRASRTTSLASSEALRTDQESSGSTGIIAGGPVRSVVELAGIKNIRTKSLGSNNKTNVVLATIEGLTKLKTPEEVAKNRGKSVEDVVC